MHCNRSIFVRSVLFGSVLCAILCFSDSAEARRSRTPSPTPAPAPAPAPTPVAVQAIPTVAFLDSLGVNTHFNFNGGGDAYANVGMMESELKYAGFRYARDTIYQHWPLAILQKVYTDTGVKFDLLAGSDDYATELVDFRANTTLIGEIEGPNEIDNWPVTYNGQTGPAAAVAFQKQLYTDIKGSTLTAGIPVDSFTISNGDYSQVGNISSYCNYSASHIYTQWGSNTPLSGAIDWSVASAATDTPNRPPAVTEFGWWTKPMGSGVTTAVQAKYALNFFFEAYIKGINRSYMYELNDEFADSNGTTIERHFGLFQADGTAKPSAVAMHNMTTILADPAPKATTGALPVTISSSSGVTINHLLMQRGDGVFVLALWQDAALWDNAGLKEITVAAQQALVNFGITASVVQVYDPMIGTTPTYNNTGLGGLTQMVPDHPVFIFIKP